ncbi:MAG: 50S ribosomal protein L10 [Candidatus Bathyarchaeota archaeon]|nr:50S ribosomal protein L10 [Candidatus Bathyarchaeota archaeon]
MSRQMVIEKAREVEEIQGLLEKYKTIGVAGLQKVRAAQLQELKKKLRDIAHLRVIKNTLMRRAVARCKSKGGIENLEGQITGSNILLFTDLNPFKLVILLQKSRVQITAKAGDIASWDVVVPSGNTGLPPGPIISQLGGVGLPTRIESGSVWINRDTLVVKQGEVIDARLASVLSKLGIRPVEAGLIMKAVYDDGLIITEEQLRIDLDEIQRNIQEAGVYAFNLSLNAAYPVPETIELLVQTAFQQAYNLSLNAVIPTSETIVDLLRKAHIEASSLNAKLGGLEEKTETSAEPAQKG